MLMREDAIIATLRTIADNPLLDDAAIYDVPTGMQLVASTDMLVENVHFLSTGTPQNIARKALGANLSDMAAMGADPLHYQLALGLTHAQGETWLHAFCTELTAIHQEYSITLSGGDTVRRCNALTITITIHGIVPSSQAITRATANQGDRLYISGTLGDAALGLMCLQGKLDTSQDAHHYLASRYWHPLPRIQLGIALRGIATSMMDISDGLIVDCQKLCTASNIGAQINDSTLPLSNAARYIQKHHPDIFSHTVSAGDDYELLFTAPPNLHDTVMTFAAETHTTITHIGEIVAGEDAQLIDPSGVPVTLPVTGYQH